MTDIGTRPVKAEAGLPGGAYAAMFAAVVEQRPDHPALVFPGTVLTYGDLWERAAVRARQLRALGVGSGDTFGIMLPNSTELVELFLGAARIGAVPVPINTRYKPFELAHVCRDGELRALVTTSRTAEQLPLRQIVTDALTGLGGAGQAGAGQAGAEEGADATAPLRLDGFPHLRHVVMLVPSAGAGMVGEAALEAMAVGVADPDDGDLPAPEAPVVIMYTSGTTSMAKGCVLTNGGLTANAAGTAERFEIPADDRWWNPLPMFHMGSLLLMSAVFSRGGTFISQERFEAGEALALCVEHRPTLLYPLFPTITLTFMQHPDFGAYDRDDVRAVCNVSPESIQVQVQEVFAPAVLISAYGMTEVCGTAAYSRMDDSYESRTRSCGPLLPGWEAAIANPDTGELVPPGTKGELIVKGPALFSGYYKNPEQTAATRDDEGFFHTGDHCSFDDDGFLYFHGRLKDVLKVGGENVSALEVEAYLATHPAIKLAQLVGIPDDRLMEVPVAFVEVSAGEAIGEDDVIAYCKGQIAGFKVPRHVRFVTEWPMSSTKIQKFRLRDQIMAELGMDG